MEWQLYRLAAGLVALQSVSSPCCQPPRLAVGRLEICLTALQSASSPCSRPRHLAVGPITLQLLILSLITRHISDTDRELHQAQSKLNDDLETLGKWLLANKLSANLVKTEYMIIATSAKIKALDHSPIIELNDKPIARATETPSLGLIIDEPYIQLLSTKIASAISAIKRANFLPKKCLITLYQSLVEPRLRYCNTVWGNSGETLKDKL